MKSHKFNVTSKKMNQIAKFVSRLSEGEKVHTATAMLIFICEEYGYKGIQGFYERTKRQKWKFTIEDADDFEILEPFFNRVD